MNFELANFTKVFTIKNSIIGGIVLILVLGIGLLNWLHTDTIIATVTRLERRNTKRDMIQVNQKKSNKYRNLVYTDKGTFKDSSDYLRGKFGSQYFYKLAEGKSYEFTTSGFDLGIAGLYPNIIDLKEVDETE